MRTTFIIIAGIIGLCSSHLWGQTNLNGPLGPEVPDNFESEFDSFDFDETLDRQAPVERISLPPIIGRNQNGQVEYSVLENQPDSNSNLAATNNGSRSDDGSATNSMAGSAELNAWVTGLVLKHMPHEYDKEKNWGKQSKRWAGVNFRRDQDDGKLETKRRHKMVNHGTWRKYGAQLADPAKKFAVELSDFSSTKDHKTKFAISFLADLLINARQSKWVKGVQLYSFSAEGTATVRLTVDCELGIDIDFSRFPPDLVLNPAVTKAKIEVDDFELKRVSKAGGEFAQQITRLARKELDEKVDENERKLVKKINDEIEENRNKLRLSIADAVKLKWFEKARNFIPENVRDTIVSNRTADSADQDSSQR